MTINFIDTVTISSLYNPKQSLYVFLLVAFLNLKMKSIRLVYFVSENVRMTVVVIIAVVYVIHII